MPIAGEFLLEAIEQAGVRQGIATRECQLRHIACTEHISGLLGKIDRILQHFQFGTVLYSPLHIELGRQFHRRDGLCHFVCQSNGLIEGQSATLVEQHARQHETVVHLRERHFSLVHLHVYTQAVASGSHALFYHLVDIGVEFLHQLEITLGEFFLMAEGYHLPVSLIDAVDGGLPTGVLRVLGEFFVDGGHLVERKDTAAHEDRLREHDGARKEVAGIRVEGVYDLLSQGVERGFHALHAALHARLQATHHLLHLGSRHTHFHESGTNLLHRSLYASHLRLHASHHARADLRQEPLLLVAQQGDRAAGMFVGSHGTHVRQELRARRFPEVGSHVLLQLRDAQLFVVAQRHLPAAVERQQSLAARG